MLSTLTSFLPSALQFEPKSPGPYPHQTAESSRVADEVEPVPGKKVSGEEVAVKKKERKLANEVRKTHIICYLRPLLTFAYLRLSSSCDRHRLNPIIP